MLLKPQRKVAAALSAGVLVLAPFSSATAGIGSGRYSTGSMPHYGTPSGGPNCPKPSPGKTVIFNKPINVYKPVNIFKPININKNLNIYKPIVINKNINANKNININKNLNINKNVLINKNIIINKGGGSAMAEAFAAALANANASASSSSVSYSGSYSDVTVNNNGGGFGGAIAVAGAEAQCEMQEATIVKSIHAVCISVEGREFAATHMLRDTWIDSAFEGEVARCIAGAHLKIVVGDVVQSDQGMAGTYSRGDVLECGTGEALRHFKNGQLKCAPAQPVPDCTERSNLRKYGTGDFFFSFRGRVCVGASRVASAQSSSSEAEASMQLDGGVGAGGGGDY